MRLGFFRYRLERVFSAGGQNEREPGVGCHGSAGSPPSSCELVLLVLVLLCTVSHEAQLMPELEVTGVTR